MLRLALFRSAFFTSAVFGVVFLATTSSIPASDQWRANADKRTAEQADRLYEEQKYEAAYKRYVQLAKKGDSFAQYTASYMHLEGQGVDQDLSQAYAWAALAAESQNPQLTAHFEAVKARVPAYGLVAAQELAEQYRREWGQLALAVEARKKLKRQLQECTGSRIGTRCDEVYAMQMPKGWSITPGDGNAGGSDAPSGSISNGIGTGGGGDMRDAEHYREVRQTIAALDLYIESQQGTVEVRDLEGSEPGSKSEAAEDQE